MSAAIYDIGGRRLRTLVSQRELGAGNHNVSWDLRNDNGVRVTAGLYFIRVNAAEASLVRRLVVIH
jgi:flagellar hook assembly protein FlgD